MENLKQTNKMKNYNQIIRSFDEKFRQPDYLKTFGTFTNLIWQILLNKIYENESVCFYIDVECEKNQLVIAFENGGYKKTDVFFIDDNFDNCLKTINELNVLVFEINHQAFQRIITKSMFGN